jgi:hypothetical protein
MLKFPVSCFFFFFQIVCRDRVWSLIASSEEERDKWIREIASQMRLKNRFMVRMQGSLHKQGGVVKSWKLRFFRHSDLL